MGVSTPHSTDACANVERTHSLKVSPLAGVQQNLYSRRSLDGFVAGQAS